MYPRRFILTCRNALGRTGLPSFLSARADTSLTFLHLLDCLQFQQTLECVQRVRLPARARARACVCVCLGGMLGVAMTTDSLPSRVFACHRVFLDLKAPSDHLVKKYVFCNRLKVSESKLSVGPVRATQFHETRVLRLICAFSCRHAGTPGQVGVAWTTRS